MESIARNGQAALNLRNKSLQTLALELAASDLAERGLKPVSHSRRILPMQQALSDLHSSNQSSHLGCRPTPS